MKIYIKEAHTDSNNAHSVDHSHTFFKTERDFKLMLKNNVNITLISILLIPITLLYLSSSWVLRSIESLGSPTSLRTLGWWWLRRGLSL